MSYFFLISIIAALQLFGALMPRILGQKKLREDHEETDFGDSLALHNSITAQELFTRHPNLGSYLLEKLEENLKNGELNPSLVPILSMLSRVSPGCQTQTNLNRILLSYR